jgi:hypothetical protein
MHTAAEAPAIGVEWIENAAQPLAGSFRARSAFIAHAINFLREVLPEEAAFTLRKCACMLPS